MARRQIDDLLAVIAEANWRSPAVGEPEPFGLVMIEAMACRTPVIAFRRGSLPEVIDDGATGFINSRFTSRRMAQDYLRHYQALVGHQT